MLKRSLPTVLGPLTLASLSLGLSLGGCASYTALSPMDRGVLEQELGQGTPEFLKVSCNVTPFFGDAGKRLITPLPPTEVDLLETPDSRTINPGAVQKVLPVGTRVRIQKIEFPTSLVVASRILFTPRTQPWVYVDVDGDTTHAPHIIVLRQGLKTRPEVQAELDQYLLKSDPAAQLESYSAPVRDAVRTKQVLLDMPADALEASWGPPLRKQISYDNGVRKEVWSYPGGARRVYLNDSRVVRVEGASS